jgi:hypothetical protein
MKMKSIISVVFVALMFLILAWSGWAADKEPQNQDAEPVQEVRHSPTETLPWGMRLADFPDLVKYKSAGGIDYYRMPNQKESPLFSGNPADVAIAFKNGKLYAYLVAINNISEFEKHLLLFKEIYGAPKLKREGDTRIFRWRSGNEKIKLKYNDKTGAMKLGIYHAPVVN